MDDRVMLVGVIGALALFSVFGFMAGRDTAGGPLDDPDIVNFCSTAEQETDSWGINCIMRRRAEGDAAAACGDCAAQRLYRRVCQRR